MIVDLGGIEAGHGDGREQVAEQVGAGLRQLVEHQRSASELGEDGEQAGPGRGLQHTVGRRDRGGGAGRKSKGDRRRELLKRLALFGAAGLSGEKARALGQRQQRSGERRVGKEWVSTVIYRGGTYHTKK